MSIQGIFINHFNKMVVTYSHSDAFPNMEAHISWRRHTFRGKARFKAYRKPLLLPLITTTPHLDSASIHPGRKIEPMHSHHRPPIVYLADRQALEQIQPSSPTPLDLFSFPLWVRDEACLGVTASQRPIIKSPAFYYLNKAQPL